MSKHESKRQNRIRRLQKKLAAVREHYERCKNNGCVDQFGECQLAITHYEKALRNYELLPSDTQR